MKTQPTPHGGTGFTLIELLAVVCAIAIMGILILAMLGRPHHHDYVNCVSNLKQIGLAFRIWEGDNGDKYPMQVSVTNGGAMELALAGNVAGIFRTMSNELSTPIILSCPQDSKRTVAANFAGGFGAANISYFVSLDAEDKYPQMILSGDDNLEINGVRARPGILNLPTNSPIGWTKERIGKSHGLGNIGLSDGSVQTITSTALQAANQSTQPASQLTNTVPNRLVIP